MKEPRADYHMALALSREEREEILSFRKQNPHVKMNGEMAKVVLAYIRGQIPAGAINREVIFLEKNK